MNMDTKFHELAVDLCTPLLEAALNPTADRPLHDLPDKIQIDIARFREWYDGVPERSRMALRVGNIHVRDVLGYEHFALDIITATKSSQ